MAVGETGAKVAAVATAVPLLGYSIPIDPVWAVLIPFSILAAWLANAAKMFRQKRALDEIGRELLVSLMLGCTVGLFAWGAIVNFRLNYVQGALVTWFLAFGGVPLVNVIYAKMVAAALWVARHMVNDAERAGQKRQEAHKLLLENSKNDRERMLRKLDLKDDGDDHHE